MSNPRDVDLDIEGHDHTDRATRSAIRNLRKLDRSLGGIRRTSEDVNKGLSGMGTSIASAVSSTGLVAIAALAAVFGPHLIALVGGALLAGGVVGMAALAAYLNRDNPQVKAALEHLKGNFLKTFQGAADPLAPVIAASIERISGEITKWGPLVRQAFIAVGPAIYQLSDALAKMVTAFLPGFVSGLQNAQPVIDVIAAHLPIIGFALGEMFRRLGANADSIAVAVDDVLTFVEGLIVAIGLLIQAGAAMAVALHKAIGFVASSWEGLRALWLDGADMILGAIRAMVGGVGGALAGLLRILARVHDAIGLHTAAAALRASAKDIEGTTRNVQAAIDRLHGKIIPVTVSVDLSQYYRAKALAGRGIMVPLAGGVSFEATAPGQLARTGGPAPSTVQVDNRVYLDGAPFYAMVSSEVSQSTRREAWRASTGRR